MHKAIQNYQNPTLSSNVLCIMLLEIVCPSLADTFDEKDGETPHRSSFPMDCGELSLLPGATGEQGLVPDKNIVFMAFLK